MSRIRFHPLLVAVAALVVVAPFAAACGGDDDDETTTATASAVSSITPSGPPVSDEEYLRVFCEGLTNYQDALTTQPKEGIADAIRDYIADMQAVNPPEDLQSFHDEFIRYLQDAVDDPTALVTRTPPKPADAIRDRLAEKEASVEECKYPSFLSSGDE